MLAGVDYEGFETFGALERGDDGSHFDGFGPGADENRNAAHGWRP